MVVEVPVDGFGVVAAGKSRSKSGSSGGIGRRFPVRFNLRVASSSFPWSRMVTVLPEFGCGCSAHGCEPVFRGGVSAFAGSFGAGVVFHEPATFKPVECCLHAVFAQEGGRMGVRYVVGCQLAVVA